ncbi:MAG TPA: SpoIID/LytB domain-containing protein, partial [Draconibacterium sp.]|nr:SpoIID/LytB domain-containing protein [Draconibacterium sp.]
MSIPKIHVGIMNADKVEFNFQGEYQLVGTDHVLSGTGSVFIEKGNIQLAGTEVSKKTLFIVPLKSEKSEFELKDVIIGVNFHWEQKENQKFQGALKFIIEADKITAVNVLSIEDYLISVISSEMSANCSLDLLKAHAIISRSWLLAQIEKQDKLTDKGETYESTFETDEEYIKWYDREDHKNFHVCADDHCQRYQGITRSQNSNVVKAVSETAGVVLSYRGEICDARFSKCCGGRSELFENCWEPVNHPYLTAVIDNRVV